MKLQKLLYYTKAWGLVAGYNPIKEEFCHWQYGPVIPAVWREYRQFRKDIVDVNASLPAPALSQAQRELVEIVVYSYGRLSAFTLSDLTHSEGPWKNTTNWEVITDDDIKAYYSDSNKNPFARNFPLSKDSTFTALQTDGSASFTLDMSDALKEELKTYPSFAAYKSVVDQVIGEAGNNNGIKDFAAYWQARRAK